MFKAIKSAIIWTLLYRFRVRLTIIAMLLFMVFVSEWIYTDIVNYLTLSNKVQYLFFMLLIKWIVIVSNVALSIYLFLTMLKRDKNIKNQTKDGKKADKKHMKTSSVKSLSNREKEFLNRKIRSKSQMLMDK